MSHRPLRPQVPNVMYQANDECNAGTAGRRGIVLTLAAASPPPAGSALKYTIPAPYTPCTPDPEHSAVPTAARPRVPPITFSGGVHGGGGGGHMLGDAQQLERMLGAADIPLVVQNDEVGTPPTSPIYAQVSESGTPTYAYVGLRDAEREAVVRALRAQQPAAAPHYGPAINLTGSNHREPSQYEAMGTKVVYQPTEPQRREPVEYDDARNDPVLGGAYEVIEPGSLPGSPTRTRPALPHALPSAAQSAGTRARSGAATKTSPPRRYENVTVAGGHGGGSGGGGGGGGGRPDSGEISEARPRKLTQWTLPALATTESASASTAEAARGVAPPSACAAPSDETPYGFSQAFAAGMCLSKHHVEHDLYQSATGSGAASSTLYKPMPHARTAGSGAGEPTAQGPVAATQGSRYGGTDATMFGVGDALTRVGDALTGRYAHSPPAGTKTLAVAAEARAQRGMYDNAECDVDASQFC